MHLIPLRSWPNCKFEIFSDFAELGTSCFMPGEKTMQFLNAINISEMVTSDSARELAHL